MLIFYDNKAFITASKYQCSVYNVNRNILRVLIDVSTFNFFILLFCQEAAESLDLSVIEKIPEVLISNT